jgi:hypothetical protein
MTILALDLRGYSVALDGGQWERISEEPSHRLKNRRFGGDSPAKCGE